MEKRVEFTAPKGVVPEGTSSGEEFDLVCTFRVKDSGQVCLTMMGDSKMPGYGDHDDSKPGYEKEAKEVASSGMAMQSDNGGY